ncbi:hypothetical protein [Aliivibrio fischeri]|uniref:Uncharacterized protein n=1 Tax=Aliivibrio fischeri TaxID=668 RepID=A0A510USP9_ALIFS|nr:hypothetical protein [Aliivibrio fischeri]GEK16230.1 hypothetical protein AFI02nite_42660 [Aliivibrio fischeri]
MTFIELFSVGIGGVTLLVISFNCGFWFGSITERSKLFMLK